MLETPAFQGTLHTLVICLANSHPTAPNTPLCSGLKCICEDLEKMASVDDGGADISAVAWAPRLGRPQESIAVAHGSVTRLLAFQSGADQIELSGEEQGEGQGGVGVEACQV
jgi:hypothetical protein